MIKISTEHCNGCGECVEVCPTGAIYLVEGRATVEQKLCRDCQACITACPTGAISLVTPKEAVGEPVHVLAPRTEPQVIQVKTKSTPAPFRAGVLPLVGGALAWAGREIVPRLAEVLLYDLDRRAARRQTPTARQSRPDSGSSVRGGGRGRRRRRRRGC
jgi:NAD-dependent dihydropyrimidine dehydrogenase PreA subunit